MTTTHERVKPRQTIMHESGVEFSWHHDYYIGGDVLTLHEGEAVVHHRLDLGDPNIKHSIGDLLRIVMADMIRKMDQHLGRIRLDDPDIRIWFGGTNPHHRGFYQWQ